MKPEVSDLGVIGKNIGSHIFCLDWKSTKAIPPNCELVECLSSPNDPKTIECLFSFVRGGAADWSVYKIIFYAGEGTFSPPEWVEKWSADRDDAPEFHNRTLFFKDFVKSVVNKRSIRTHFFTFYAAVPGR